MHIENKSSKIISEFITQFPEERRNSVINFLLILGFDIARKLGQNNQTELFQTMKQLSKFIINDCTQNGQTELREEIKKIQQQLVQLNSLFNNSENEQIQSKSQDMHQNQLQTKPLYIHNRFYTQNDMEDQINSRMREEQLNSTNSKNQFKPAKRNNINKSPFQQNNNNLTAKITESPPPPMIYQNTASNKFNIKPHLDDHQIKQLLYSQNEKVYQDDFDSISNRGHQYNQSPKSIKYTLNIQNFDNLGQRFQTHETNKKIKPQQTSNSSRQKKKVPAYLQNVESKIKHKLDQDKQAFKNQKNFDDDDNSYYNYKMLSTQQMTANFQNNNNNFIRPSQESDTYYEIQQYLINQQNQNYHLSPVQEMKTDNEIISNKKKTQNFSDKIKSSLKSSQETRNLRQNQQQNFFEKHENLPYQNSITPIQVSDFQMSKQQSDLSFEAFRKKAQFTSPYAVSLQQSSQQIHTAQKPQRNDEESSESFSNFTPPNKEISEFLSKQCIYLDQD
ncbi:unnamed protein product [Paramecium sonneborni]|uniref:Uncharacterized protein n=1 Tax=Paramecium sonneborni TaxID=65129 RepID=A0A8S1MZ87_9CILI|nr:unnamed protein product [Paramecium sonneborni]